jgi:hypothetical protein
MPALLEQCCCGDAAGVEQQRAGSGAGSSREWQITAAAMANASSGSDWQWQWLSPCGSARHRGMHACPTILCAHLSAGGEPTAAPAALPCLATKPTACSDLGCHIDGYIAQSAHSLVVAADPAAPVTGRAADVILAAQVRAAGVAEQRADGCIGAGDGRAAED